MLEPNSLDPGRTCNICCCTVGIHWDNSLWTYMKCVMLACEKSLPSSLPALVAFREKDSDREAKKGGCFRTLVLCDLFDLVCYVETLFLVREICSTGGFFYDALVIWRGSPRQEVVLSNFLFFKLTVSLLFGKGRRTLTDFLSANKKSLLVG